MTDIIERIRQREAEHQMLHERDASIPSCLPAGCSPDQGDIPVLLAEVDRLRQRVDNFDAMRRARNAINLRGGPSGLPNQFDSDGLPINAQGHVDCPQCATAQPADPQAHPNRMDAVCALGGIDDIERQMRELPSEHPDPVTSPSAGIVPIAYEDGIEVRPASNAKPCPECGITPDKNGLVVHVGPHSWSVSGKEIAKHVDSAVSNRARQNAGRPRNCPNSKTCHGRLKSATDKEAGLCKKCRKTAGAS